MIVNGMKVVLSKVSKAKKVNPARDNRVNSASNNGGTRNSPASQDRVASKKVKTRSAKT